MKIILTVLALTVLSTTTALADNADKPKVTSADKAHRKVEHAQKAAQKAQERAVKAAKRAEIARKRAEIAVAIEKLEAGL